MPDLLDRLIWLGSKLEKKCREIKTKVNESQVQGLATFWLNIIIYKKFLCKQGPNSSQKILSLVQYTQ